MVHHLLSCTPYVNTSIFILKIINEFIVLYGHRICPLPSKEGTVRKRSSDLREARLILGLFNNTLPTDYWKWEKATEKSGRGVFEFSFWKKQTRKRKTFMATREISRKSHNNLVHSL
jgi:hypothetical protein